MTRRLAVIWLVLVAATPAVRAEHARIDLRVMRLDAGTGQVKTEVTAHADEDPPLGGVNPRPLLKVKAGDPMVLQFILDNTYPHGVRKDVTVHYFVVPEAKPRQKQLPDLTKGVVTEGKLTMDFKPKCRVGARLAFTIPKPGLYLLRVQTINTQSDHEHFSAVDVQAE
jgi:hypothetical protein